MVRKKNLSKQGYSKHGYINTWILQIYQKYWSNISGYFDKNIDKTKIIQNSWKHLEKLQKMIKINKNIHNKVIF